MKGEGERETYSTEGRVPENSKARFLTGQGEEIHETTERGRLEIPSRKLDTKGTLHAKIGTVKDKTTRT